MKWFWDAYAPDAKDRKQILASPLRASLNQLSDLPKALVITDEADVLRDEGEAYAAKLRAAGNDVTTVRYEGIIHDFAMLNALAGSIPPRERVITCEEVFELRIAHRDLVGLQCRQPNLEGTGEITLRRLVKEALRMRPRRIIIGEVREAESLDMLIALNAGVPGMCTVHANSAREALTKICTLPLLAGENVTAGFVVPTVASAIDVVVHLDIDDRGRRRTREVVAVPGRVENGVVEATDVFRTQDGALVRGDGFPPHPERFACIGVDVARLLRDGR